MKWYHSIITKISVIFALALLGIAAVFYSLSQHERNKDVIQMLEYSRVALHSAYDNKLRVLDFDKLHELGFSLVEERALIEKILATKRPPKPMPLKHMEERMRFSIDAVFHGVSIYTIVQRKDLDPIILKTPFEKELLPRILFPLLIFGAVIAVVSAVISSLRLRK